jgi:CheY-like chemotaxis protein
MPAEREKQLVQVLRKIPIFEGLAPFQVKRILGLCKHRSYKPREIICRSGTPSDAMYILISGELIIVSPQGARVATILPVTTVGEMGVLTGQPRSATVEVSKSSAVLIIQKAQFDRFMNDDLHIQAKVFQNIVEVLSYKLGNDNVRMRDFKLEIENYEERVSQLEANYKEAQKRTDTAFALVNQQGGIPRDELEPRFADALKGLISRVLLVDEDADCRALLDETLGHFEVVQAANGREAVTILGKEQIDIVVTDIYMADFGGYELLKWVRQRFPNVGVIGLSWYIDADGVEEGEFDGFVEKPIDLLEFQRVIEEVAASAGQRVG